MKNLISVFRAALPGGADEPEYIEASFETVKGRHDQVSRAIQRVTLSLLGASLYCAFALGRSDGEFLKASGGLKLPLVGVEITMFAFLMAIPIIYSGLTFYLLALLRFWHRLNQPFVPAPGERRTLQEIEKLPFFFNQSGWLAGLITYVLFFFMVPFVLYGVSWKAWPHALGSQFIFPITLTLSLVYWSLAYKWKHGVPGYIQIIIILLIFGLFAGALRLRRMILPPGMDLRGTDLRNYDFQFAHMPGVILDGADLRGINFEEAELSGASFKNTNLRGTNFTRAILAKADFSGAKDGIDDEDRRGPENNSPGSKKDPEFRVIFYGAKLWNAVFHRVSLQADFQSAQFDCAEMVNARFSHSRFRHASFYLVRIGNLDLEKPIGLDRESLAESCIIHYNKTFSIRPENDFHRMMGWQYSRDADDTVRFENCKRRCRDNL